MGIHNESVLFFFNLAHHNGVVMVFMTLDFLSSSERQRVQLVMVQYLHNRLLEREGVVLQK